MQPIPETTDLSPRAFHEEVIPAGRPLVIRGLTKDWPVVAAARRSPADLAAYVRRFDRGQALPTLQGPPAINGRFHYNRDLTGFNFQQGSAPISAALDFLLRHQGDDRPPAFAIQSAPARSHLPGFEAENPLPLLGGQVEPRAWIGNRVTVAAHHDPSENIACVAAGRRRFTLFPPEQVANLYMGPFEMTPAGATISMVDFDAPDLARYPDFPKALEAGFTADLEPGDAIYIPYLWWHEVRSLAPLNVLVNYWWAPPAPGRTAPRDAFFHALLALRDLPPHHRKAWQAMLEHYVFGEGAGEHLPQGREGVLGELDPGLMRDIRAALADKLNRA